MAEKLTREQIRLKLLKLKYGDDLKNKKTQYNLTDDEIDGIVETEEVGGGNSFADKLREAKRKKDLKEKGRSGGRGK